MDSFSELMETDDVLEGPALVLPQVGEIIDDKYAITKLIGEGGMGAVYEAMHLRLNQLVALKFLHPAAAVVPGAMARFEREARASAQLRGPHVAQVLDVDVTQGAPYMVMELLRGRDLEVELRERGSLPVAEAVDIVLQVCSAMSEAHALGIVHRDLKPSNIFLAEPPSRQGEAPLEVVAKVLDFGISLVTRPDAARVTATSVSLGTPLYMSPEQVRCSKRVDARTDIWSMGVILYELLAGDPPFSGEATAAVAAIVADETPSVRDQRPDIPAALDAVIARALAKDVRRRFQNVDVLADALAPFGSGRFREAKPMSGPAQALATYLSWPPVKATFRMASQRPRFPRIEARRARFMVTVGACLFALPAITWAGFSRSNALMAREGATCSDVAAAPDAPFAPRAAVTEFAHPTNHVVAPSLAKAEVLAAVGPRNIRADAAALQRGPVRPRSMNDDGVRAVVDEPSRALETTPASLEPAKTPAPPRRPDNPLYL